MKHVRSMNDLSKLSTCSLSEFLTMKIDAPVLPEMFKVIMVEQINAWRKVFGSDEMITKEDFDKWYYGDFVP